MDQTDTSVFDTLREAAQHLLDMYYDRPDDEMTEDELIERAELEVTARS